MSQVCRGRRAGGATGTILLELPRAERYKDGAMAIVRERAQVVHAYLHETRLARAPHDSVIERAGKKFWKNRDDIKPHGRDSVTRCGSDVVQM